MSLDTVQVPVRADSTTRDYFRAVASLEEFLNYADERDDIICTVVFARKSNTESTYPAQAELTILNKVGENALLVYFRRVGDKKGSYGVRSAITQSVLPVTVTELRKSYPHSIVDAGRTAESIMHPPDISPL